MDCINSKLFASSALAVLMIFSFSVQVQAQSDRLIELDKQRQEALQREREKERRGLKPLPAPDLLDIPAIDESQQACIEIAHIFVEGATKLAEKPVNGLIREYEGQCLGLASINTLIGRITNLYIEKAFITSRAYLPEQNIRSGNLRVKVIEGTIESFEIVGGEQRLLKTAFPKMIGRTLNLREIEQGLDVLNQAGGQAKVEFHPGEKVGGTRVKILYQKQDQVVLSVSTDNSGQESTGKRKVGWSLSWDNPFNLNDSLYINTQPEMPFDSKERYSRSFSAAYSVPYGRWLFASQVSLFKYFTHVESGLQDFDSWGKNRLANLSAKRLLSRDQNSKTFLDIGLKTQKSENYINDVLLQTSSRSYDSVSMGLASENYFSGGNMLLSSLSLTKVFNVDNALSNDDFTKANMRLSWHGQAKWWHHPVSYQSSLNGQYSPDAVFSSEALSLGSQYTVRGFDEIGLTSESGFYWRNELSSGFRMHKALRWNVQPFIGVDYGQVRNGDELAGASMGLRWQAGHFQSAFTYARAIKIPQQFSAFEKEGGIHHYSLSLILKW